MSLFSYHRPYFEMKANFNKMLEEQRNRVQSIEQNVLDVKSQYADALHNLEGISEEIHEQRKLHEERVALGERSEGVGSETPPPAPGGGSSPHSSIEDVFVESCSEDPECKSPKQTPNVSASISPPRSLSGSTSRSPRGESVARSSGSPVESPSRDSSTSPKLLETSVSSCELSSIGERRRKSTVTFDVRTDLRNIRQELLDLEEELYPMRGRRRATSFYIPEPKKISLKKRRETTIVPTLTKELLDGQQDVCKDAKMSSFKVWSSSKSEPLSLSAKLLEACAISEAALVGGAQIDAIEFMRLPQMRGNQTSQKGAGLFKRKSVDSASATSVTDHMHLSASLTTSIPAQQCDRTSEKCSLPISCFSTQSSVPSQMELTTASTQEHSTVVRFSLKEDIVQQNVASTTSDNSSHVQVTEEIFSDSGSVSSCEMLDDQQLDHLGDVRLDETEQVQHTHSPDKELSQAVESIVN